jgi:hypothetical protein
MEYAISAKSIKSTRNFLSFLHKIEKQSQLYNNHQMQSGGVRKKICRMVPIPDNYNLVKAGEELIKEPEPRFIPDNVNELIFDSKYPYVKVHKGLTTERSGIRQIDTTKDTSFVIPKGAKIYHASRTKGIFDAYSIELNDGTAMDMFYPSECAAIKTIGSCDGAGYVHEFKALRNIEEMQAVTLESKNKSAKKLYEDYCGQSINGILFFTDAPQKKVIPLEGQSSSESSGNTILFPNKNDDSDPQNGGYNPSKPFPADSFELFGEGELNNYINYTLKIALCYKERSKNLEYIRTRRCLENSQSVKYNFLKSGELEC